MKKLFAFVCALFLAAFAVAQQGSSSAPDSNAPQTNTAPVAMDQTPMFHVKVMARTTKAVNYRHRGGSTTVDFKGTSLMPEATGKAKINGKEGRLEVSVELKNMQPATKFGGQYLTYVLWAITPEGRAVNLGEMVPDREGKSKIDVTTDLQAFGLLVTAEPYFSVIHPSDLVVAENVILNQTKGFEEPIDAKFDVLEGGEYTIDVPADQLPSASSAPGTPLNLLEARNAVAVAKAAGAQQYAPDSLSKAEDMLARAEDYFKRKQGRTPIGTAARGATQMAEDARVLTLKKKETDRIAAEKRAMEEARAKAEAEAKASAEAAAKAQAQAEEDARKRAQAEADREAAELAKAQAEKQQAEADAARAAALAQQQQAEAAAEKARLAAQLAEQQKQQAIQQQEAMRARLLNQLNQVLETRDTPRGLVVNMPDVLFAIGKYELKPAARERLARISGILLAYPDLRLEIDGFTDSTGSEEYNQLLSEKRAGTVRDYLVDSGVPINNVIAKGMGESNPIADNATAAGRKLNRRVEMVVSGDVIGTPVGTEPAVSAPNEAPAAAPVPSSTSAPAAPPAAAAPTAAPQ
jgi:outer membrane protein OmpA-like peptidoglycan-associated protein